jgi:hypothetical protein
MAGYTPDIASLPPHNQGLVSIGTENDLAHIDKVIAESSRYNNGVAQPYGAARSYQDFAVPERHLMFRVKGTMYVQGGVTSMTGGRARVIGVLNGLGAEAARVWAGRPDLIAAAVEDMIVPLGFSLTTTSADQLQLGVTIALTGLQRVRCKDVQPGDILVARVPMPFAAGHDQTHANYRDVQGQSREVRGLVVERMDARTPPEIMLQMINAEADNLAAWADAMTGKHTGGPDKWRSANRAMDDSYKTAVVLALEYLMREKILVLNTTMVPADAADALRFDAISALLGPDPNDASPAQVAQRLAQFLNLTKTQIAPQKATRSVRGFFGALNRNLTKIIFFDGRNAAFQYGRTKGPSGQLTNVGLYDESNSVATASAPGQLLLGQLNHFKRAWGGAMAAINKTRSMIIGKAVTQGTNSGAGSGHCFLLQSRS